jgi:hypothetical protein
MRIDRNTRLTSGLALLLPLAVCGARLASAAGVANLQSPYNLTIYQVNQFRSFDSGLDISPFGGPGQVAGSLAGETLNGKLTNKGKFTFTAVGDVKIKNGKGQMSATGRFILGSFKVTNSGNPNDLGDYLFRAETSGATALSRGGNLIGPLPGLAGAYVGKYHDNAISDTENQDLDLSNVQQGSNGKFTATMLGVPVSGKRSGTNVIFQGKQSGQLGSLKLDGQGTLDFSHLTFMGKLTKKGTGSFSSGKGTFELYATT